MAVQTSKKHTHTKTNRVSFVMVTSNTDACCYRKQHLYKPYVWSFNATWC